jgi:hypothetical protein
MHTISQEAGSAKHFNKVLEEKSPRGSGGSKKGSSKNHLINDTMKQRDSFPPYDALGSEKANSARKSEEDPKWIAKAAKVNEMDKFES